MKILILKPSSLGDVVQALPVLRLIKQHLPGAQIHWWIASPLAPLLEGDPDLAGVVRFERRRWATPAGWPELIQHIRWLRAQKFEWVIDLQSLARSGAFGWLANGELLIGLDDAREGARGFYDICVPRASYHTHAVDWYLAALKPLGVPIHADFDWLPEKPAVAAAVRARWKTDGARWVALSPGARWANKRWPIEYYAEFVHRLSARFPEVRFVVLGGADDQPLGQMLAMRAPERCLDLTGQTTLPELVEWLRLAEITVTNDTGPMHLAAALDKPVVAIFGPTEARRTGPYGQLDHVVRHALPCAPCMKSRCAWPRPMECLSAISPVVIFQRAQRLLESASASQPSSLR